MKIVWVVRPAEGGIVRHLQQLLQGICDWEIVVAGPSPLERWIDGRRFIPVDLVDGLNWHRDWHAIRSLRRILKQERAAIVHAHGFKAAMITAGAMAPKGQAHFLFTAHNALPESGSFWGRWWFDLLQQRLLNGFDTIISVSEAVRTQIVKHVPENKVLTIYNGVPTTKFGIFRSEISRRSLGLSLQDQVVGTVARLVPNKGINTLLEAGSLIAKIVPQLRLIVVGEGPERAKLQKYARALNLEDRVQFLGWREDVPELMAGWDLFALPTLGEGFNLSVLEAMASSLPVVVSDLPSLREAVVPNRGGLVVLPGNAPELAAALLHLLKSPDKARSMGVFNRNRVNTLFDQERMIECTRALYEGLKQ